MTKLTAGEIESGTSGILSTGSRDAVFSGVSIDSRTVGSGEIFFAIRGPNQDGHNFVATAFSQGAAGVVVEKNYTGEIPEGRVMIRVENTHEALKSLARAVRLAWRGTLAAITGSMGKTTSREFAYHLIKNRFHVCQTPGNYNNLFGLPLALLGLSPEYEVGLFEMGMSAAGEIAEMCGIALPTIGILTNVAPVHLEFFASIEEIAEAKGELVSGLPIDGTLIYNADDPLIVRLARSFGGGKISFGKSEGADIRADNIEISDLQTTRFRLSYDGQSRSVSLPFPGAHYVWNVLPGIALSRHLGITIDEIPEALGKLRPAAMRGGILRFQEGFTVIDDSYNANPNALRNMIETLTAVPGFSRRVLVAGEMLELGKDAPEMHFECGEFAVKHGVDVIIGIRGNAEEIVRAATHAGIPGERARFFENAEEAAEFTAAAARSGDLILVKGSRGVHTEKVVKKLTEGFTVIKDTDGEN